jgi:cell wall-associated NlpC family hydrolase
VRRRIAGHGRVALGAFAALAIAIVALVVLGAGSAKNPASAVADAFSGGGGQTVDLDPIAIARARLKQHSGGSTSSNGSRAQVVVALPPGVAPDNTQVPTNSHAHAPTDAEIQHDLTQFRNYLATIPPTTSAHAAVLGNGEAAAPFNAPQTVIDVVEAANQIALKPYVWGGGHGAWRDKGYDCSGSVSFALAAAGLLDRPLVSTDFESYGDPGPGKWITIYANSVHAWMTIAGLRFDTGGLSTGTRWQASMRPTNGFVVRHPPGF